MNQIVQPNRTGNLQGNPAARQTLDLRGVPVAQDFFVYNISNTGIGRTPGAIAPGATAIFPLTIERDSAFELLELSGGAAQTTNTAPDPTLAPVNFLLVDSASSRSLFSASTPLLNLVGIGQRRFQLPVPRRFMPSTQITITVTNTGLAAIPPTSFSLSLIGRKIFMRPGAGTPLARFINWTDNAGAHYSEDFYVYDFTFPTLAPGATLPVTNLIEADSAFEWIVANLSAVDGNGFLTSADGNDFTMQIRDGGTSRDLFNQPLPAADVTGNGIFPFELAEPRIFLAKTPVTVTLQNGNGGLVSSTVHLSFIGRKIFQLG